MTLTLPSCNKYEDGPAFSLISKKARVANTWKIDKILVNGDDVSSFFTNQTYTFEKDGTWEWVEGGGNRATGTWEFNDSKESIILREQESQEILVWEIKRLTSKEIWVEMDDAGDKYKIQFASK